MKKIFVHFSLRIDILAAGLAAGILGGRGIFSSRFIGCEISPNEEPVMSQHEPTDEEIVEAIYEYAAEQMANGLSGAEIEGKLMAQGLDRETAASVVRDLNEARYQSAGSVSSSAGARNMLFGALWCIGGLVVTAVTYSAASGGGTYVVAWGAILFGGIQFFRGMIQMMAGD